MYQSTEEKAQDNHSSAIVLLSVGGVGFILDLIFLFKNPLGWPLFNRYLTTGIMGCLFVLFMVMGVLSLRNAKRFLLQAQKENNLKKEIVGFCDNNLTKEIILDAVSKQDDNSLEVQDSEQTNYFERTLFIKKKISEKYLNLDEGFLDRLVDEYYSRLFE